MTALIATGIVCSLASIAAAALSWWAVAINRRILDAILAAVVEKERAGAR